jgi:hypothetical protein
MTAAMPSSSPFLTSFLILPKSPSILISYNLCIL